MTRVHGIDLIRFVSFFAIAIFHITYIHYYTPDMPIARQSGVLGVVEFATRTLAFSGFTIVFLASFLTAYSRLKAKTQIKLFVILLGGWLFLSEIFWLSAKTEFVWDVYPLIFSGLMMMTIASKWPRAVGILWAMGVAMLWVPFWSLGWQNAVSPLAANVLGFAPCSPLQFEWPIFPWVGLTFVGYGTGKAVKLLAVRTPARLRITPIEWGLWAAILGASVWQWGAYFNVRMGPWFACDAYRQAPLAFWAHFAWVLFAVRASFDPYVQSRLSKSRLVIWISGLRINRSFWLAYVVHLVLAFILSDIVESSKIESTVWNARVITVIAIVFMPMIEITTRLVQAGFAIVWRWLDLERA